MSSNKVVPVVGMGVTMNIGSDSYPCTVVEVISEKRCVVQQDRQKRTDSNGLSEDQSYLFIPNPEAEKVTIYLNKYGNWKRFGGSKSYYYSLGKRRAYSDPSF